MTSRTEQAFWKCVGLVLLGSLVACGNGVPGVDGGQSTGPCSSNSDCVSGEICVNNTCTPFSTTDGGEQDAGVDGGQDGGSPDGGVCTTDTWSSFAQPLIVAQCLNCHEPGVNHNFTNSYQSVRNNRSSMRADVANGSMPRSPQSLTADERTRLLKWFDCGLPQ